MSQPSYPDNINININIDPGRWSPNIRFCSHDVRVRVPSRNA